MSRSFLYLAGLAGAISLAAACSAAPDSAIFGEGGGGDSNGQGPAGSGGNTAGAGAGDGIGGGFDPSTTATGSTGSSGTTCTSAPDEDKDKDGFSVNNGDCNDCDPNVNPGAIEVIAQPDSDGGVPEAADEDCDGTVDNVASSCDDNIALTDTDAMNGARAIELCQQASANDKKWGVLSAKYTRANGGNWVQGPEVGIQKNWGPNVNVQGGKSMLVISSGKARLPNQPDACNDNSCSVAGAGTNPPNFPQTANGCGGDSSTPINDDVGLEVKLRAPTNATGYSFNFDFYSFEYPEWVCTTFNDQFIALVNPPPMGAQNGNISFDSNGNPVSVNIAFFDVCSGCPLGTSQLQGTGFDGSWGDDAGATGWLETQAPVSPGQEFSIRFTLWDTGDTAWDSTALIDNFQWIANGGTVAIGTDPVPVPK